MIYLGDIDKEKIFYSTHPKQNVYIIGDDLPFVENKTVVSYQDTIMYKYYYDLLQKITSSDILIINEIMKTKNRYDLHYNCIRKYALSRPTRLIFQTKPIIDSVNDLMVLYDFDSDSPFLKQRLEDVKIKAVWSNIDIALTVTNIVLSEIEKELYQKEKLKIASDVRQDPDIIPRRLLKYSEELNTKITGRVFDKKNVIKQKMNICVNDSGVDRYYYQKVIDYMKELENVKHTVSR
jgi:hypothetical protein